MLFSSFFFTFTFLPMVLILYYLVNGKYRKCGNYILLVASIYFYSYGEPVFIYVMIGCVFVNYLMSLLIDKYRQNKVSHTLLTVDVLFNIVILFLFKYFDWAISIINNFFRTDIPAVGGVLPIGISFFIFQTLSYVVDVYRGTVKVQKNPFLLMLYISFFPQLVAGPIVRYSTIEKQLTERKCTLEGVAQGSKRFLLGFSKKVIIADNLSRVVTEIFSMDVTTTNPLVLWIGSICFSLQILYDFSGYSDMAIGLGKLFGFEFLENFDYPYISKSVTEFWRRWHMSLGQWFKDYVYIPLGGSRVSVPKHILNMFVVWLFTGIWHGANFTFIFWGVGYFVLLVIEKYIVKPDKRFSFFSSVIWRTITLLAVNFGWVLFNSKSLKDGICYWLGMFGRYGNNFVVDGTVLRCCREYGVYIILGVIFSMPISKWLAQRIVNTKLSYVIAVVAPFVYGIIFLLAVSYVAVGNHNPFIYFNF